MHCDKGKKLARSEFSRTTLQNVSRTSFYCCAKCEERRKELQQKVCGTKIKCDCPEGIHQVAREECAIFSHPLRQRWPGKDCNRGKHPLTWDDVQFLNRLPTVSTYSWWHKLLDSRIKSAGSELICHMHCDKGKKLARTEFSHQTRKHAARASFLYCTKCDERKNDLRQTVQKWIVQEVCGTKIKCDCSRGLHQAAREKCAIVRHRLLQTWPGKRRDRGRHPLSWDDVQFLNRLPTKAHYCWWHKLLGRSCKQSNYYGWWHKLLGRSCKKND